ncbi:MAG: caspase family protein [Oricola sp.]|nr:caspase family protein [Oricola sp.]
MGSEPSMMAPAEYRERFLAAFPGLEGFLFDAPDLASPRCDAAAPRRTHALIIAADRFGQYDQYFLEGPANDAALLRSALVAGGASDENIVTLAGDRASRAGLAAAALDLLRKVGCDDTVVLHFSGTTFMAGELAFGLSGQAPFDRGERGVPLAEYSDRNPNASDLARLVEAGPFLALNQVSAGQAQLVSAPALSELVTQFRNRMANVVVILDSRLVADTDLQARQAQIDPARLWTETQIPFAPETADEAIEFPEATRLSAGHGGLTTFYAAGRTDPAFEMKLPTGDPDGETYGIFSYKIAVALLSNGKATVPDLARRVETVSLAAHDGAEGRDLNRRYIFETTDPSVAIIAEQRPPATPSRKAIKLTNPAPTRSAAPKKTPEIEIRGLVEWPAQTMIVTVDGRQAQLTPDGRFSLPVKLKPGRNEITISALTRDVVFHELVTEIVYEGDREALTGTGTRYAVLIANQNYSEQSGMARLETPFADIDALAAILTDKYGYVTEASFDGRTVPLVLKDASGPQIADVLFQVSQFAGDADSVLIYYAGHGIYEQVTGAAFWVPADARAGYPPSYYDPDNLSKALTRIQAGNVIVISDSCYSGQLLRGGEGPAKVIAEDRLLALQRLSDRRSRILITSGGNEPVADTGGGGHSVFARALLTGLEENVDDAFSARELFDGFIVPMVIGRAAQEPQYRAIEKSGHEGGDVVFVRMDRGDP